jgi:hypothetical protein
MDMWREKNWRMLEVLDKHTLAAACSRRWRRLAATARSKA